MLLYHIDVDIYLSHPQFHTHTHTQQRNWFNHRSGKALTYTTGGLGLELSSLW